MLHGWLFLTIDHPINDTDRATLWEVHLATQLDRWRQKTCSGHKGHRRCTAGHWVKVAG